MDTRQIQNNSFSEGIISDLHPLTTPNTCLVDALNATILTYNGNEFLLQNEQGNYKLEHCKLPSNFIPVGTTEYGDTLYVASYNPITKETEIGTYPSPRTIFSTKDRDQKVTFVPLVNGNVGVKDYTDLIQNAKLQIYALADDMENFKLNPGDKFIILLGDEDGFPYQTIGYHVLTDNKELIPIDVPLNEGYIWPLGSHVDDEDFKNVFWEVPGWLAGKYRLAVMDQFYLNVRSVTLPEFTATGRFNVSDIQINTQMEVSDDLFRNNPRPNANTLRDLKVEYRQYLKISGRPTNPTSIGNLSEHGYNDDMDIYYNNWTFNVDNVSINDIIVVEAVPYIEYSGSKIYYDQFRTIVEINLSSINDARDIKAADTTFHYTLDNDSCTLTFNINGPFINNTNVKTQVELYNLCGGGVQKVQWDNGWDGMLTDVNYLGQNIIDLPMTTEWPASNTRFSKENMYIFSLIFSEDGVPLKRINQLLIVSDLFSKFIGTVNFADITIDQWLSNYNTMSNDITATLSANTTGVSGTGSWMTGVQEWINEIKIGPNPQTFEPAVLFQEPPATYYWYIESSIIPEVPVYKHGINYQLPLTFKSTSSSLTGCLWNNIDQVILLKGNKNGDEFEEQIPSDQISEYTFTEESFFGESLVSKYTPVSATYSRIITPKNDPDNISYPLKPTTISFLIIEDYLDQQGGKIQVNARRYLRSINSGYISSTSSNTKEFHPYVDRGEKNITPVSRLGWNDLMGSITGLSLYIFRWQIQNHNEVSYGDSYGEDWNSEQERTFIYALLPTRGSAIAIPFKNTGNLNGYEGAPFGRTLLNERSIPSQIMNFLTDIQNSVRYSTGHSTKNGIFVNVSSEIVKNDVINFTELEFTRSISAINYRSRSLLSKSDVGSLDSELRGIANSLTGTPLIETNPTSNLTMISTGISVDDIKKSLSNIDAKAEISSSEAMSNFKTALDTKTLDCGKKQSDLLDSDPMRSLPETAGAFYIDRSSTNPYYEKFIQNLEYVDGKARARSQGSTMYINLRAAAQSGNGYAQFVYCAPDTFDSIPTEE